MAAKRKTTAVPEILTQAVSVRLSDAERARLETLAGDRMPLTILMRIAMTVGLDAIEADPRLLLGDRKVRK